MSIAQIETTPKSGDMFRKKKNRANSNALIKRHTRSFYDEFKQSSRHEYRNSTSFREHYLSIRWFVWASVYMKCIFTAKFLYGFEIGPQNDRIEQTKRLLGKNRHSSFTYTTILISHTLNTDTYKIVKPPAKEQYVMYWI